MEAAGFSMNFETPAPKRCHVSFIGLVQGKIYRKPWFSPSNIWVSCIFFPSTNPLTAETEDENMKHEFSLTLAHAMAQKSKVPYAQPSHKSFGSTGRPQNRCMAVAEERQR
jgi:hypothetical protein